MIFLSSSLRGGHLRPDRLALGFPHKEGFTAQATMEFTELFVIALLLFGAVLHGITGLGFPMISTMSVAILFPLPLAIALVVLPNVFINIMILLPSKRQADGQSLRTYLKKYTPLIVAGIIGCILGVVLLKKSPLDWLYLLLGLATLFYVFYTLFGQRGKSPPSVPQPPKNNYLKMLFFGFLAGVVGGATNAMSSILMIYLLSASNDKNEIVKTSNFCFLLAKIVQIILLSNEFSQLEARALWAMGMVTLLSVSALFIGIKIRDKLSIRLFKRVVLGMLFLLSLRALWQAFSLMV